MSISNLAKYYINMTKNTISNSIIKPILLIFTNPNLINNQFYDKMILNKRIFIKQNK